MLKYAIFLSILVGAIIVFYYALLALQCWGVLKFSKEEVSFPKILIPFYYFFV